MSTKPESFSEKLSSWKAYQEAPWGRLFYSVSQANMRRHLQGFQHPLRILDVGGGNGVDAIAYAQQGHSVTIVDVSPEMLADARHKAEVANVTEQIRCCHAGYEDIPTLFPEPVFDVLLCHNVVQYVDNPTSMLDIIFQPLKSNGLLSLIGGNRFSEAYREMLQQMNPQAARDKLEENIIHSGVFDTPIRLYTVHEFIEFLESAGFTVIKLYGVRCVFDYIQNNEIKTEPNFFAQLEQLEYEMSGKYPYYLLARYFQIIACKSGLSDPIYHISKQFQRNT